MSFCVHCGVKLQEQLKECPLCHTPIIDPSLVEEPTSKRFNRSSLNIDEGALEFTGVMERPVVPHKRVFSGILSIVFFAGLLVTLIVDISVNAEITWSFYTMISITTAWFLICFPLINRGRSLIKIGIFDLLFIGIFLLILDNATSGISWGWFPALSIVSLCGLLLIFSLRKRGSFWIVLLCVTVDLLCFLGVLDLLTPRSWFLPLALPILLIAIGMIGALGFTIISRERKHRSDANGYLYGAMSFVILTLGLFGLNIVLSLYTHYRPLISWAHFTLIFSIPLFVFCFIAYKNERIRINLTKKFRL